jgi:hypothetical protein
VAISKADKAMEYVNYAKHCLKIVRTIPDQESRIVHREMAAEWMKLAGQSATDDVERGRRANGPAKARTRARS